MSKEISKTHILEAWGDFACFSRPEMKVERYSYPCPTPSAARGVFEAVYFKPEFRWQVTRIELLAPPAYIALRRNEVKDKANVTAIQKWIAGKAAPEPLWADGDKASLGTDMKGRTQRQTMALRNPRYRLSARIVPRPGKESQQTAHDQQFARRASQGKCFQQPYLGCREFVAFFRYVDSPTAERPPASYNQDLGWMLYDVFDLDRVNDDRSPPFISVFRARIENGVLDVPPYDSDAVRKPERRAG
jgi:CRISPR-associated protein Cas5d